MALIGEEYLCSSLVAECEAGLLMQHPSPGCICPHCCGIFEEHARCPVRRKCFEKANETIENDELAHCEAEGVYAYKTSSFIMLSSQSGLVTPESAIDILAISQQLEQSSPFQKDFYAVKFCKTGLEDPSSATCGNWNIDIDKDIGAGCIECPFGAAKMIAVLAMLRDFPAVIGSDSYMRQMKHASDGDGISEVDDSFALTVTDDDEHAILLLRACVEELGSHPAMHGIAPR